MRPDRIWGRPVHPEEHARPENVGEQPEDHEEWSAQDETFSGIHLALGRLNHHMDQADKRRRLENGQSAFPIIQGQAPANAAGLMILDLGAPPSGFWWQVRAIRIGGAQITSAPAGTGWLLEGGSVADLSMAAARYFASPLPAWDSFGSSQLVCLSPGHLWGVITGGTPNTLYTVSVTVEQLPLRAMTATPT